MGIPKIIAISIKIPKTTLVLKKKYFNKRTVQTTLPMTKVIIMILNPQWKKKTDKISLGNKTKRVFFRV